MNVSCPVLPVDKKLVHCFSRAILVPNKKLSPFWMPLTNLPWSSQDPFKYLLSLRTGPLRNGKKPNFKAEQITKKTSKNPFNCVWGVWENFMEEPQDKPWPVLALAVSQGVFYWRES